MSPIHFETGNDDFRLLRQNGGHFVDKSRLIAEVIHGSAKVVLLPRPRRFGKTLNMRMLKEFFRCDLQDQAELFAGLGITGDAKAMSHAGKYPTVFVTLKDLYIDREWESVTVSFQELCSDLVSQHWSVLKEHPDMEEVKHLDAIKNETAHFSKCAFTLKHLLKALYEIHGQPCVLIVDEYDSPIIRARAKGHQVLMLDFMRTFLGSALKPENGQTLYRGVVTGILRVAKESLFSDLNNFQSYGLLEPQNYADLFGFTPQELQGVLKAMELENFSKDLERWYNGYIFGNATLYNPWSVICALQRLPKTLPGPHWINTSQNSLVYEQFDKGGAELKKQLEELLEQGELRMNIDENLNLQDLDTRLDAVWSLLLHAGYLKASDPQPDVRRSSIKTWKLSIPNEEVRLIYDGFADYVWAQARVAGALDPFLKCFTHPVENLKNLEYYLQELVLGMLSYHDTAKKPEAVFHAFVLGLLTNLRYHYEIHSQMEVGFGRADITMRPTGKIFPHGYVIEFKTIAEDGDVESALQEALAQIEHMGYATRLLEQLPPERVHKLAIVLIGSKGVKLRRGG